MKIILFLITAIMLTAVTLLSCKKDNRITAANNGVVILKANGNIRDDIEAFRELLGPLNTVPGAVTGRREVNWDAVPQNMENKSLPSNFFNPTGPGAAPALQRGLVYAGKGNFMVSSNGFAAINNEASSEFSAFSGAKTFANTTSATWDITFQRAATTTAASVQGFGLVCIDVDKDSSTSLEFFTGNKSLGKYFVPAHDTSGNFSFFGIYFKNTDHITKVTVAHDGFLAEGAGDISEGGTSDLVVLDDLLYSEPLELQ